jgi:hypothetical protein
MGPKNYRAIGQAIRDARPVEGTNWDVSTRELFADITGRIADVFQADNPRFDRARFLEYVATGVDRRKRG